MIEAQNNTTPFDETTKNREFAAEELHAVIRTAEQLRSEMIYQALSAAFRYLKQAPSRLFSVGAHRHA